MAGSKHGRYANVKVTPTHFARIPLDRLKPKVEDRPLKDDERIVAPVITVGEREVIGHRDVESESYVDTGKLDEDGLPKFEARVAQRQAPVYRREVFDAEGRQWFCLEAEPRGERFLREGLIDLGFSAYLPLETLWVRLSRVHPKAKRELQKPILNRYVFAGIRPDQDWRPLFQRNDENRNALGIVGILGLVSEMRPTPLDVHEVAPLAALERKGLYDERKRADGAVVPVKAGEEAEVVGGPFAGLKGVAVQDARAEGVKLALKLFGRETFAFIPIDQVENLSRIVTPMSTGLHGPLIPEKKCA